MFYRALVKGGLFEINLFRSVQTSELLQQEKPYLWWIMYIHSLVFSLEGWVWQEPEPSHVTGTALAHCILVSCWG